MNQITSLTNAWKSFVGALGSFLNSMWALAGLPWFRLWTRHLIVHAIVTAKTWVPIGHPHLRYSFGITAPPCVTIQRFRDRTRIRSFLIHSFHSRGAGQQFPAVPYCLTELVDMVRTEMFTCNTCYLRRLFSLKRMDLNPDGCWVIKMSSATLVKSYPNLKHSTFIYLRSLCTFYAFIFYNYIETMYLGLNFIQMINKVKL